MKGSNIAWIDVWITRSTMDLITLASFRYHDRYDGYGDKVSPATYKYIRKWARNMALPFFQKWKAARDSKATKTQHEEAMMREKYLR